MRALAVSGARRSPGFPDLPTIAEAGVPGYEAGTWTGVIAPAGLPRPIVDKLNAAVNDAIRSPSFIERFAIIGDEPAGGTPRNSPTRSGGIPPLGRGREAFGREDRLSR